MPAWNIRPAIAADAPALVELMRELARYERLENEFVSSAELLGRWLFGPGAAASALVGEVAGEAVAYAIYFRTFSTFLGEPGLWLEDLYVRPEHRGSGLGKALMASVAAEAVRLGYRRLDWVVLDWNQPAIDFYLAHGAKMMEDWKICRLEAETLRDFAAH